MSEPMTSTEPPRRYVWPWFIAAAVIVAIIIAIFSIRAEANRIRQQRNPQIPDAGEVIF